MGYKFGIMMIAAPLLRIVPPWWKARLYARLAGRQFSERGHSTSVRTVQIAPHRYEMELCLDDPMERFAYFCRCYWGLDVTATVQRLMRQGDYFIDVGANLGFLTLCASKAVGPGGKVFAFEPLKVMAGRLRQMLSKNRIENVMIFEHALGDVPEEATLDLDDHSSKANLRRGCDEGPKIQVLRGDDVIGELPAAAWVLAKLDVEGYELRALKGFRSLIRRPQTAFLVEVTDSWLKDLGGSAEELFELMVSDGYRAYVPKLTALSRLSLQPIERPDTGKAHYDVVFMRAGDRWLERPGSHD